MQQVSWPRLNPRVWMEFNMTLSCGTKGPKYLSHHLCLPGYKLARSWSREQSSTWTQTLWYGCRYSNQDLNHSPMPAIWGHIYFFLFKKKITFIYLSIYLFLRQSYREREIFSIFWFTFQLARMRPVWREEILLALAWGFRGPCTCAILHRLPSHTSTELDWKWSHWDLSCAHMNCWYYTTRLIH